MNIFHPISIKMSLSKIIVYNNNLHYIRIIAFTLLSQRFGCCPLSTFSTVYLDNLQAIVNWIQYLISQQPLYHQINKLTLLPTSLLSCRTVSWCKLRVLNVTRLLSKLELLLLNVILWLLLLLPLVWLLRLKTCCHFLFFLH